MIYEGIKGVPKFECDEYGYLKKLNIVYVLPIINEGERIAKEIERAKKHNIR